MLKRDKKPIVEVEWIDAQSSLETHLIEELNNYEPYTTFSVGYLVVEKEDFIVLAFTDFGEGMIKHFQCIPRSIIKKIEVIREE